MIGAEKLFSLIDRSSNILLLCHRNPDSDTAGAAGAMAFYISSLPEKNVNVYCSSPFPENLNFMQVFPFVIRPEELNISDYDLVIALDCADLQQVDLGDQVAKIYGQIPFVNIDHHATNNNYADLNMVDSAASATSEIVYRLFKKQNITLTLKISACLLTGIITDTTYFTNNATTKQAVAAAADLLRQGVPLKQIINNTFRRHSPDSLKVWGKTLSNLHYNADYKVVTAIIEETDLSAPEQLDGLANFLTTIYDANLIIVLREEKNIIRCSLRTTAPGVDVSALAKKFGGGGHPKAAGFSIRGQLEKTDGGWKIV